MNARIATVYDGLSLRRIVAFDVFRWNLRLGIAIAPREVTVSQRRRRKRVRSADIPSNLRADVGLPPEDRSHLVDLMIWHMKM